MSALDDERPDVPSEPEGRARSLTAALVRPRKLEALTADERLAEMGALFAAAYRRYRRNLLADGAARERPCDRTVDATKEVA